MLSDSEEIIDMINENLYKMNILSSYLSSFLFYSGEMTLDVEVAASGFTKEMQQTLEEVCTS